MEIKLKTPKDVCDNANEVDYKLRNNEQPRFTWWFKLTKTVKAIYIKVKL